MTIFRIMHLSDLHIAEVPGVLTSSISGAISAVFQREVNRLLNDSADAPNLFGSYNPNALGSLAALALKMFRLNQITLLLITGDICATGLRSDLEVASDFVQGRPGRSFPWLHDLRKLNDAGVVRLLPGNHDRYDDWSGTPNGMEFDKVFEQHWSGRVQSAYIRTSRPGANLAIIMGDFSLRRKLDGQPPIPLSYLGQGRAYRTVVDEMVAATRELRNTHGDYGVVWAVHFPPCYPGEKIMLRLIDGDTLISAAAACSVKQILCGHTHSDVTYTKFDHSPVTVYTAPAASASSSEEFYGAQVIEFDVENAEIRNVREMNLVYDHEAQSFIA